MCVPNAVKQQIQSLEGKLKKRLFPLSVWGIGPCLLKHLLSVFLDWCTSHLEIARVQYCAWLFLWRMMFTLYELTSAIVQPRLCTFCVIVNWIFLQECWSRGWGAQTTWRGTLEDSHTLYIQFISVLWQFLDSKISPLVQALKTMRERDRRTLLRTVCWEGCDVYSVCIDLHESTFCWSTLWREKSWHFHPAVLQIFSTRKWSQDCQKCWWNLSIDCSAEILTFRGHHDHISDGSRRQCPKEVK